MMSCHVVSLAARQAASFKATLLPSLAVATAYAAYDQNDTACDQSQGINNYNDKRPANVRRKMTAIGRFSLETQTDENPSVPTFFLALSGPPLSVPEFVKLWKEREMETRHPRFHSRVSETHPTHFEPMEDPVERHITESLFPQVYRSDLMRRIQTNLLNEFAVWKSLWQLQISSGPLGTSGAISKAKSRQILEKHPNYQESLLLFRTHHALADGVSIMAALSDLCDEAQDYRDMVIKEIERRQKLKQSLGFLQRLAKFLKKLIWFCVGSVRALLYQLRLSLTSRNNPFAIIQNRLDGEVAIGRTVSWCDAAPVEQVKSVAKSVGRKVTINDLIVSCVAFAVAKQLEEHERLHTEKQIEHDQNLPLLSARSKKSLNVAIPVHLGGGVLLPGRPIGNHIGAFVARVPGHTDNRSAKDRLLKVHESLYHVKRTPAPLLAYWVARCSSACLPSSLTKWLFARANSGASFVVSNPGRGPPSKMHIAGRTVEAATAFLPLPPGIPIGIVANSYAGTLSLSVTAEKWAVPDADKFLSWVLDEYQRLLEEANL